MNEYEIKNVMNVVLVVLLATLLSVSLFSCKNNKNDKYVTFDGNLPVGELIKQKEEVYKKMNDEIAIFAEEAARGKTVENTKRTVNEYGITIYGKPISENEAVSKELNSEIGIKNDKKDGIVIVYTEYYSDVQGSIIYLSTVVDTGSKEYFNKDGIRIGTGSSKSANVDIETILANVKMGNAMAEAIDRSVKKNK